MRVVKAFQDGKVGRQIAVAAAAAAAAAAEEEEAAAAAAAAAAAVEEAEEEEAIERLRSELERHEARKSDLEARHPKTKGVPESAPHHPKLASHHPEEEAKALASWHLGKEEQARLVKEAMRAEAVRAVSRPPGAAIAWAPKFPLAIARSPPPATPPGLASRLAAPI